jgi:hypothetical protein
MRSSVIEAPPATAKRIRVSNGSLIVELADGRVIAVPLEWFPRLTYGTASERAHWRLIGRGTGIHWPELDEDISVAGLIAGEPSGESQASLREWLNSRSSTKSKRRSTTRPAKRPGAKRSR